MARSEVAPTLEGAGAATSREVQADDERGGDESLTALTALVVPELPVTSTIAAKILGIQRAKLDGGGVKTMPLGRALVAPFGQWLAGALLLVPPPPGLTQLAGLARVEVGGEAGKRERRR